MVFNTGEEREKRLFDAILQRIRRLTHPPPVGAPAR